MKWPKLKRDHVGLYVKTLVDIQNGWCTLAAGTICIVEYSRAGLSLRSERCEECGVRVSISRVGYSKVELINPPKSELVESVDSTQQTHDAIALFIKNLNDRGRHGNGLIQIWAVIEELEKIAQQHHA